MTTVTNVNNTTPAPMEAPKLSGAAPKRGRPSTPPTTRIAEQAIQAMAAKEAEAANEPVISRRTSSLTSISSGTESSSSSTTTSSTLKVPAKRSVVAELEKNVGDLSQAAQDLFADALTRYRSNVAALRETFNGTNEKYTRNEKMLDQGEIRQRLKKLTDEEGNRYKNMHYNRELLDRRVACVHKTIMKLFIEFGILQHSIIGNDSVLQSTGRYGADYRLWEMGAPDNTDEKTSIVVKDDSKESPSTALSTTVTSVEHTHIPQDNLTRMLHEMVSLKERATIYFEALKLTMYSSFKIKEKEVIANLLFQQKIRADIAASDFPKKYYLIYSKQFADLNDRIKSAVGLNKTPPEIADKQGKLATILSQMQVHFKLVITKEEADARAPVEEILSPECSQAFDLVNQITVLKTDVLRLNNSNPLLGTSWDNRIPLLNRGTALKREVAAFKAGSMAQRLETINKALSIYKAHMDTIKGDMDAINDHFNALEAASRLRTTWKLDPTDATKEVPSTPTAPQAATSSSSTSSSGSWLSSLFSWGTTSTVPATTAATTTTSTTTVTPVEASTVATTTVSTTIPDPVTITAPSTASTVTATTTASTSTTTIPAAPATAT